MSLSVISFSLASVALDPRLSLVEALLTAVDSLLPSSAIFFLSIQEKNKHMTTIMMMRATTTPEAAAACSFVTVVSPIVNADLVPHLSPTDIILPCESFLSSGISESSTGATNSISKASSSGAVGVFSAPANYVTLLTSVHVVNPAEPTAGIGLELK